MESKEELEARLVALKREYRGIRSLIEMMEKGTSREVLRKMRAEKLDPIELEIEKLERLLKEDP